jgi:hypothetical protein
MLRIRMRSQRLCGRRLGGVREAVSAVFAIQAQDTPASRLAVRARSQILDAAAVIRACNEERSVVRTWAMRFTLHMVAAEDVRWLVALLGPRLAAAGRRRRLQLGLDDELAERGLAAIRRVLADRGPMTRPALIQAIAKQGIAVDPRSQAPAHLLGFVAARGLVCRGPDRDKDEPTYVLLDDWVGPGLKLEPAAALAELARRYFAAYGPAGTEDFAGWSGLPLREAREGLALVEGDLKAVEEGGRRMWILADEGVLPDRAAETCVRLLGRFDTYLLGYRDRDIALPARFARRVQAGGGIIHPAVVEDGRVVGTWRLQSQRDGLRVAVEPFEQLRHPVRLALRSEAEDLGRFLGRTTTLEVSVS